jgi:hypothetical protein
MASDRGRGIAVKYRIALAFVATSCMAGAAFAADLPVGGPYRPGPFMVRQPVEWTGIYFGANAGYGWGQYSSNIAFTGLQANSPPLFPAGTTTPFGLGATELSGTRILGSGSPNGAIAGGQIGFNWQAGMLSSEAKSTASGRGSRTLLRPPAGPPAPPPKRSRSDRS